MGEGKPTSRRRASNSPLGGGAPGDKLFEATARWAVAPIAPGSSEIRGPRHQTLRRRGDAPSYPKPSELAGATMGRVKIYRKSLALIPNDPAETVINLTAAEIVSRLFYRDSMTLITTANQRFVIGLAPADAEVIDVLCQAYL